MAGHVFVSYAWESEGHKRWVLSLVARLRAEGVQVLLDQRGPEPGDDLDAFMAELETAAYVLLVATPAYRAKYDAREGGVGKEAALIEAQLDAGVKGKFIPLLRAGEMQAALPVRFHNAYWVDLRGEAVSVAAHDALLGRLLGRRPDLRAVGDRAGPEAPGGYRVEGEGGAALELNIEPGAGQWRLTLSGVPEWTVPNPLLDAAWRAQVVLLAARGMTPIPLSDDGAPVPAMAGLAAELRKVAASVGTYLADRVLGPEAKAILRAVTADARRGYPAALRIRVRAEAEAEALADTALALPWELLFLDGAHPVEASTLDVVREAVVPGLEMPPLPDAPLSVVASVAAPVDQVALDYEGECYRLWRALGATDDRFVITDRGTVDDFVDAVITHRPPVVHFTGHGSPGKLAFEDERALADTIPIDALLTRLRAKGRGLPRLMYLASCHGSSILQAARAYEADVPAREEAPKGPRQDPALTEGGPSTAASLHRAGFREVVAYFGPVGDAQSTRAEERFYRGLAQGLTARAALREARVQATEAHVDPMGRPTHAYPLGWAQLALYSRGPEEPVALAHAAAGAGPVRAEERRRVVRRIDVAAALDDVADEATRGVIRLHFGFVGRRSPRARLLRKWDGGQRYVFVCGLGGLGKTALATDVIEPVRRLLAKSPRADGTSGGDILRLVLDARPLQGAEDPMPGLWAQVAAFREDEAWAAQLAALSEDGIDGAAVAKAILFAAQDGLLVYVDDAESLQRPLQDGRLGAWRSGQVATFWKVLRRAAKEDGRLGVLASSRYVPEDLEHDAEEVLELPKMREADTVRLLSWFPTLSRIPREDAAWLAGRVDGHPRTVQYLDELVQRTSRRVARRRGDSEGVYRGEGWRAEILEPALPKVEACIDQDLAFTHLWAALGEAEQALLGAATAIEASVPWGAFEGLGTEESAVALARAGLITPALAPQGDAPWYAPHRRVADRVQAMVAIDRRLACERIGAWFEAGLESEAATVYDAEQAVRYLCRAQLGTRAWPHARKLVLRHRSAGRYREAFGLTEQVLDASPEGESRGLALTFRVQLGQLANTLPPSPIDDLRDAEGLVTMSDLSFVLNEQGKLGRRAGQLPAARAAFERALEVAIQHFGTEAHPDVAASLHELAGVLKAQGDLPAARKHLEQALRIQAEVFGTEAHPDVAASLHELAGVLKAQGDLPAARKHLEQALRIQAEVFGTEAHPDVAASLHALAGVLQAQGDLPAARKHLEQALRIKAEVFGTEAHPSVAASLHALAGVLAAEGRTEAALATYHRVLEIEAGIFGTLEQYHSAETEFVLGSYLFELGRAEEGTPHLERAIRVLRAQVPNHPILARLGLGGAAPMPDPNALARGVLQARAARGPLPDGVREGLDHLAAAGAPHDRVAETLRTIGGGGPLPEVPADLPDEVRGFLAAVVEAAS